MRPGNQSQAWPGEQNPVPEDAGWPWGSAGVVSVPVCPIQNSVQPALYFLPLFGSFSAELLEGWTASRHLCVMPVGVQ